MSQGFFIALEGIDGAGTTTHTKHLADALRARGQVVHATREPSDGPVGVLLRQILTKRVVLPDEAASRAPSWTTLALLFAADRSDHLEAEILPKLARGMTVITDRYDHSSVAYQSVPSSEPEVVAGWVRELNRHAKRPDLTIVLTVPADVGAARRSGRTTEELFDDNLLQARLGEFYAGLARFFPTDRLAFVRADRPLEEVRAAVLAATLEALASRT